MTTPVHQALFMCPHTLPSPPPGVTGLVGWWDASVAASFTFSTSTNIDTWADQSGNGNNVGWPGGGSSRNQYEATGLNSLPSVNFSGANNGGLIRNPVSFGTGNTLTVFFVGQYSTGLFHNAMGALSYESGGSDATDNTSFVVCSDGNSSSVMLYRNGSKASRQFYSSANTPHRCICTVDSSGVMTIYIDGVSTTGNTLNAAFGASGYLSIGQRGPNAGNDEWNGKISEIGLATGFSNSTDVATLDTWLKNKWGL